MKPLRLEDLSTEQKIGQLLVARSIRSQQDYDFAMELIKNHALGGVQAFVAPDAKEKVIDPVLAAADYPIFISADMEEGYQLGEYLIPGNLALGALDDPEMAYTFAKVTAMQAKKLGYNMIWSPCIDLAPIDANCRITRTMGSDPDRVARLSCAYMKAFADCGVIGSAKHYPSPFDQPEDTHMCEGVSYHTEEEFVDICLRPYLAMINELGEDMMGIMTNHVRCMNIDPENPATFSKKCLDMIKNRGFKGVMMTDSLAMMGVIQRYGDDKMLGYAVAAGNDLILPNYRISLKDSYNYLLQNYRDGMFSEERLNDAVSKVLWAQERTMRQPAQSEISEADKAAFLRMNRDCIGAVTDPGLTPAIDKDARHLFIVLTENDYIGVGKQRQDECEISFVNWWDPAAIAKSLKEKFPNSDVMFMPEFPNRVQNEKACAQAVMHDDVVFFTFCESAAYQGTDGLTDRMRSLMHTMAYHIAAVVHVGNPYAMEKIDHVPRILFGYKSQRSAAFLPAVLAGEIEANGTLPIDLKLQ